uniref:Putative guanosine-3',5'-bis(Diphosphate) 3'-pyrophosphohydrolase, putative (P)ppGpp synthetase I, SpoT/RelA n=1 Tax=Magnetococcus massalia (strain MO-1) TaxID=451514 RepID=A0A1S7LMH9_MAGMO|nr:putative guanosine-3',5'-bis(diphosphate) 3'-pyrophosphohydrolase, putative (P)ppGpp synthetase I, SpoT/RelA [Candidatus Magnetococcus massalia]
MQSWDDIIEGIKAYHPDVDEARLRHLVLFLNSIGWPDPELDTDSPIHPFRIAQTLIQMRLDGASVVSALLVHPFSQELFDKEVIEEQFDEDVAFLVEGISRISLLSVRRPDDELIEAKKEEASGEKENAFQTVESGQPAAILVKDETQAEGFRKLVLAMARDIRVILIRLILCLHQLRHAMRYAHGVTACQVAHEVLEIYAPIAHRLGIYWIKSELEDLGFRLKWPGEYDALRAKILERRKGGEDVVQRVVAILGEQLSKHGINGEVFGREKHLYSVWTKLSRKQITLDDMFDLIAYRIIVPKPEDCYRALGMIHSEFKPIPGRFKDYIALPKRNGYQSLHTVVFGPFGNRIEIQIRTEKMHQIAESGVAAHWTYKGKGGESSAKEHATGYAWLKDLLALQESVDDPGQFFENVKFDLFPEEIYVFTPQGEIVTLPAGATPVDFAYAVHSEVGNGCQGAKINGRIVPLKTELETGDTISIMTGKNREPNPNWLQMVVTSKAKYWIGRFVKERQREASISLGREMLEREGRKLGCSLSEKQIRPVLEEMNCESVEELYNQIGVSRLSPVTVIHHIFPDQVKSQERKSSISKPSPTSGVEKRGDGLQLTGALEGLAVQAGRCCSPLPGDAVVGIITTGRGITLHRMDCANLQGLKDQPERWVEDIDWNSANNPNHSARLRAMVSNRRGVLTPISQIVTEAKANLLDVHFEDRDHDPCVVILEVEVSSQSHLESVLQNLRSVPEVRDVDRVRG